MNVLTFLTLDLLLYVIVIVNTTERSFTSDFSVSLSVQMTQG